MTDSDSLAEGFDALRAHLRAVAYRMLGSTGEAEDAVQEAWLRLNRADGGEVEDLRAWLTTVVARVSLDMLRSRRSRREESLGPHLPEPIVTVDDGGDPEYELLLADSMGLALLVVLETLSPAERLAFVLHDIFAVPFDEIASIVDRSPDAARQLASRGRRRIRDAAPDADPDRAGQREVVDAFLVAAREGDFEALLGILDPRCCVPRRPRARQRADRSAARGRAGGAPRARLQPSRAGGEAGARQRRPRVPRHSARAAVRGGESDRQRRPRGRGQPARRPCAAAGTRPPGVRQLSRDPLLNL